MSKATDYLNRPPTLCHEPTDALIGRDPPLDLAQIRTALLDAIDEADWLKHGIDTLDEAMESGAKYTARRFILNAVRAQALKVKAALQDLDAQEWRAAR